WHAVWLLPVVLVTLVLATMWWWDKEPAPFEPREAARALVKATAQANVTGATTTATLIESVRTLLDKRGGYLSNDMLSPAVFMDNVPNWEFGALTASRDLVRSLRNEFSRSQSQSTEDADLAEADPLLNSPNDRWLLPSSEGQYGKAIQHLDSYLVRLTNGSGKGEFYARADNLADYLQLASSRLGSLSQRLSASVGQISLPNPATAGSVVPHGLAMFKDENGVTRVKTPWSKLDDNFYEARGYTWALMLQLKAFQTDFAQVLAKKNAAVSLDQVIRELEEAQHPLGSPVVLNGSPFGFFANHSLVMANYVSRANAALIDLRALLQRG
ncbi:MAG TPA: DUF2333 family protein, partial [Rhodanobacteraceae bacterium]|nr:DUF2333 family protein [Rhodanobacteraceae bacterium]